MYISFNMVVEERHRYFFFVVNDYSLSPSYCFHHFWVILDTCEEITIEIDKKENIQNIFIDTSYFTWEKFTGFLRILPVQNVHIFSPFRTYLEYLA